MKRFYVYALLDSRKPGKFIYDEHIFDYEPFYIGKGCGNRYKNHFSNSSLELNNDKDNRIKSIIEDGYEPLSIKIEDDISEGMSISLEIYMIYKIGKSMDNKGTLLNIRDGGDGPLSGDYGKKTYKICNKTHKILSIYSSVYEASWKNNICASSISRCCLGRSGYVTRGGFIWSFDKNIVRKDNRNKAVNQLDIDGIIIKKFSTITEAAKSINRDKSNILSCCTGVKISSGGYLWEYSDSKLKRKYKEKREKLINLYKIVQIINEERIIHNSVKGAAIYNDISLSCVTNICKNKLSSPKYFFEYLDMDKRNKYIKSNNTTFGRKKVIQIINNNEIIHDSVKEAAIYNDIQSGTVVGICKGRHGSDRFILDYYNIDERKKYEKIKKELYSKPRGSEKEVVQLTLNNDFIKIWSSVADAATSLNLASQSHISNCCRGIKKKAYNYKWIYNVDYKK